MWYDRAMISSPCRLCCRCVQAFQRGFFGSHFGPRTTPGGKSVLQPGWEEGDGFPRLQHALLPWLFFKSSVVRAQPPPLPLIGCSAVRAERRRATDRV